MHSDALDLVGARHGHFRLESGHHGDYWLDLETLCLRPARVRPLAAQLAARLAPYDIDAVCGPLVEGAFVALMVAAECGCDFTYAERFAHPQTEALFPVEYRLPRTLHPRVSGKRIAIVNDVISAGSAVRGTFARLQALGARVVAIGALLVLGTAMAEFAHQHDVSLESLAHLPNSLWLPAECPLCAAGVALERVTDVL